MLPKSYPIDEIEVGINDFLWCMATDNTNEQGNNSLRYECVGIGSEHEFAILHVALQPHAALTALYKVLLCLVFRVQFLQIVAQVDEHLIFVHPVGEIGKLTDYLILKFV